MRRRHGQHGWFREFIWVPKGPAGIALFVVLVITVVALLIALSVVLLTAAVAAGVGFALYQGARRALHGEPDRVSGRFTLSNGRRRGHGLPPGASPLEQYLADVEQYDALTTSVLRLNMDTLDSWRGRRRLTGIAQRAAGLRESAIAVERSVTRDATLDDTVRSGIWELIVAANDVHRFTCDLLDFPSTRGRAAQLRELQSLAERRETLGRRRDELVRRLQQTDMRGAAVRRS